MDTTHQSVLIKHLQRPELYEHSVTQFAVVETHISFILLTGQFAYKIKKPVNLGFLDFSTLEKRKFYCEEELRLNRRTVPELYLDIVPITGSADDPHLGGNGKIIEYALQMRQFSEPDRLDHMIQEDRIKGEHIDELAEHVAAFHEHAAEATSVSGYSTAARVCQRAMDNFPHISPCVQSTEAHRLKRLRSWTQHTTQLLADVFTSRLERGRVRECHGDMHLANMVVVDGRTRLFDCLEFSPQLRWIDVASDVAFTMMDLFYHDREDFANRLWLHYLEHTGDYEALSVLRFYLVYRALVRAKVACIQIQQKHVADSHGDQNVTRHILLAEYFVKCPDSTPLIITHGLSGSGKTWLTEQLVERTGAIRIRSDIERRRVEIAADAVYSQQNIELIYRRLLELAARILELGYSVVVDATFLMQAQRQEFRVLAERLRVPFHILHCTAAREVLERRIMQREKARQDPSEATLAVLNQQLQNQEELTVQERNLSIDIDTMAAVCWNQLIRALDLHRQSHWVEVPHTPGNKH